MCSGLRDNKKYETTISVAADNNYNSLFNSIHLYTTQTKIPIVLRTLQDT